MWFKKLNQKLFNPKVNKSEIFISWLIELFITIIHDLLFAKTLTEFITSKKKKI